MSPESSNSWRVQLFAVAILAIILALLGFAIVPCHLSSIWSDREFTGWVVPIANRIGENSRMYETGLHSPLPPLSFVFSRFICSNQGTWFDESLWNYFFQCATLIFLLASSIRHIGAGPAFAATLATTAVFLSLPKSLLYDSLAQFLVAVTGIVAFGVTLKWQSSTGTTTSLARRLLAVLLIAAPSALLGMTKQNTGAGAVLGVMVLLLLVPAQAPFGTRLLNALAYLMFTASLFTMFVAAFTPWVSPSGMLHDVLIHGSEPKGGTATMARYLGRFALEVCFISVTGVIAWFALRRVLKPRTGWGLPEDRQSNQAPSGAGDHRPGRDILFIAIPLALFVIGIVAVALGVGRFPGLAEVRLFRLPGRAVLTVGLALSLISSMSLLSLRFAKWADYFPPRILCALSVVFISAALFHCLSVGDFALRWDYDNNPLVFCSLALAICLCLEAARLLPRIGRRAITAPLVAALAVGLCLPRLARQTLAIRSCKESWPEIASLGMARMRPESAGMRELVLRVRQLCPSGGQDKVLLLPEDPHVEAWFDRPRPDLNCAIIFTDQYWDNCVDGDFKRLQQDPPKVIIIGPRKCWRSFSRVWHVNRGAERLIDLVLNSLLPARYSLYGAQRIVYHTGEEDFMDIYTRRELDSSEGHRALEHAH